MATIDPSLVSDPGKKKWVDEISEIMQSQLQTTDIDETPSLSIFQIPDTITSQKPEAYEPQLIGLGPNHHFRPLPYMKMQQKKLASVTRVLKAHNITNFKTSIVDEVTKIIPLIRSCYDIFLQYDDVSMAWVFAIDGLYLYNILRNCQGDAQKRLLAQDIMMEENQVPFMLLQVVRWALNKEQVLLTPLMIFRSFCEIHSPLELCPRSTGPPTADHLLHYMYHSIIQDPIAGPPVGASTTSRPQQTFLTVLSNNNILDGINQVSDFMNKLPRKEIVDLYERTIITLQNFSRNKISILSASKLTRYADFKFETIEGIRKIRRIDKVLCLPRITLNNDSEVILRNLVAYELLIPKSDRFPLTEYIGLMCGLILNVDDVRILKEKNIIKGELGDNEVVKLFVGMSSSILRRKTEAKSELQIMMEEVKRDYRRSFIWKLRGMASFALEKLAEWLLVVLKAIGSFVGATWKFVAFGISVVTVCLITYKAYCDVFGYRKTDV